MITLFAIHVEAKRVEIEKLGGIPIMKVLWRCSDQVSADEDVEDASDEGSLLSLSDILGIVPPRAQSVDSSTHTLPVFL